MIKFLESRVWRAVTCALCALALNACGGPEKGDGSSRTARADGSFWQGEADADGQAAAAGEKSLTESSGAGSTRTGSRGRSGTSGGLGGEKPVQGEGDSRALLEDMRLDEVAAKESAKYWAEKGDEAFERNLFEDAETAYERSLQLDPSDARVRERRNLTLSMLGKRAGEIRSQAAERIAAKKMPVPVADSHVTS